jgi:ribosome-binding protein aMBF1 (putative translation factor)
MICHSATEGVASIGRMDPKRRTRVEAIDVRTRERIVAHLRRAMERYELNMATLAERLEVSDTTISRLLRGQGACGLDLVIRINRKLRIDADVLLNHDPDARYFRPPAAD